MHTLSRHLVWILTFLPAAAAATRAGDLPARLPADTLVYVDWPGLPAVRNDLRQSALMRLIDDPQVRPWIDNLVLAAAGTVQGSLGRPREPGSEDLLAELAGLALEYPCEAVILNVAPGAGSPGLEAGLVVHAGRDNGELAEIVDEWMKVLGVRETDILEVRGADAIIRRTSLPRSGVLLQWGVIEDAFVLATGSRLVEMLMPRPQRQADVSVSAAEDEQEAGGDKTDDPPPVPAPEPGYPAPGEAADRRPRSPGPHPSGDILPQAQGQVFGRLSEDPAFAEIHRQAAVPGTGLRLYVRPEALRRIADGLSRLAGFFGSGRSGEPAGILGLLHAGIPKDVSSTAIALEARREGLLTTSFQAGDADSKTAPPRSLRPLEPLDLTAVPQGVRWAVAGREDLAERFAALIDLLHEVAPSREQALLRVIERFEARTGAAFEDQLLTGLGETWWLFDSPCFDRPWSGGLTLVLETRRGYRTAELLCRLAESIPEHAGAESPVRTITHRGTDIYYLTADAGTPWPAPAWAELDGRLVLGPYPQTVRSYLDHLLNRSPSLLDDPAFARSLNQLPPRSHLLGYIDTAEVVHSLCSQMLQGLWKAAPAGSSRAEIWPSPDALAAPLFPTVFARTRGEGGTVSASFGPLPLPAEFVAAGGLMWLTRTTFPSHAAPGPDDRVGKAAVARSMLTPGGPVVIAIELFRAHMGRYPRDLMELVQAPRDPVSARRWQGPYLRTAEHLRDPWGNPLAYACPANDGGKPYDLWSPGPDGHSGTEDDIRIETRVSGLQEYAKPER